MHQLSYSLFDAHVEGLHPQAILLTFEYNHDKVAIQAFLPQTS